MTSRKYIQLDDLTRWFSERWRFVKVGEWGGGSLEGKLRASIKRMEKLLEYVLKMKPDISMSSGSVEAARISYGLKIPHILISDTPHSPVNRLTAPVSERVLTPWIVVKEEWLKAGALGDEIIRHYRALDPCFWLKDFKPDRGLLERLGVDEGEYVFLRMPETMSSYLEVSDEKFLRYVRDLPKILGDMKLVISCRYEDQLRAVRKLMRGMENVIILGKPMPMQSLIYFSSIFIGGGGTMTQEAALLGVPSISIYPGELPTVIRFLVDEGLIERCERIGDLPEKFSSMMEDIRDLRIDLRERAERLWRSMEDPGKVVLEEVSRLSP